MYDILIHAVFFQTKVGQLNTTQLAVLQADLAAAGIQPTASYMGGFTLKLQEQANPGNLIVYELAPVMQIIFAMLP